MAQSCHWIKIRTKQWLVLDASAFQCMRADFLCTECDNFACLHTCQDQIELNLKGWFFLPKSASSVAFCVVQAHTQPYSFFGRLKLIICQNRHELSVTLHEISTSCKKKTLDGGPYTMKCMKRTIFFLFCWNKTDNF